MCIADASLEMIRRLLILVRAWVLECHGHIYRYRGAGECLDTYVTHAQSSHQPLHHGEIVN